jgi:hypothetical protein
MVTLDNHNEVQDQEPAPEDGSPISGTSGTSELTTNTDDVLLVTEPPSISQPVHPVLSATMAHFDGEVFKIDGVTYHLKDIKVDYLRKFCRNNDVKMSDPPHKSLRTSSRKIVEEEIKAKKGRILNDEPDPWCKKKDKDDGKPTWVNRYRLANVIFSEHCRQTVSERGKTLTREELDLGLKTDQRVYEKIAAEYNKTGVPAYDEVQYDCVTIVGAKNLPSNFEPIDWQDAKKATKECINHLEKARQNFETSGTHDSDIEDAAEQNGMEIGRFTNIHYVVYWNLFVEENGDLFVALTGELDESVYGDSTTNKTVDSTRKKRKHNDMVEALQNNVDVDKERLHVEKERLACEDRRLACEDRRNDLLQAQVEAHQKQAEASQMQAQASRMQAQASRRQAAAMEYSAMTENIHRMTQDRLSLEGKLEQYEETLCRRISSRKEMKKRMKAHQQRKAARQDQFRDDDDGYSSEESNASLMDKWESVSSDLKVLRTQIKKHYEKHFSTSNSNETDDSEVE